MSNSELLRTAQSCSESSGIQSALARGGLTYNGFKFLGYCVVEVRLGVLVEELLMASASCSQR